jgi:hypothetical protein
MEVSGQKLILREIIRMQVNVICGIDWCDFLAFFPGS